MDFAEREAAVEKATGVTRGELEALGLEPEPTRPDIDLDGWLVRSRADVVEKLVPFQTQPGDDFYVVVVGRAAWEWGTRGPNGDCARLSRDHAIEAARLRGDKVIRLRGDKVIRRRPGGEWEEAPAEALRPPKVAGLDPEKIYILGGEELGTLLLEVAGAATRPLMEEHRHIVFPSEQVAQAVSELVQHDQTQEWLSGRCLDGSDVEKAEAAVQELLAGRRP
jgi:hypothetical protein